MFLPQRRIGIGEVGFDVDALYFLKNLVRAVFPLIFDVENGIDEVLVFEEAETILPAERR